MRDVTKAFYQRMVGDSALTALLSQYQGNPAIFMDARVPPHAETPYVHSHGLVSQAHLDTKTEQILEPLRDIGVFVDRGSENTLFAITRRIHDLFHRHDLAIDDANTFIAEVSGPLEAPTDEYIVGSILTVRLRYEST